jgi:hypothetical protein
LLLANSLLRRRFLPWSCWWVTPGYWMDRGSWDSCTRDWELMVKSPSPSCHCDSSRPGAAYWRGRRWLSDVFDNHVFCHVAS